MQNSKSSLIAASLGLTAYGYAVLPSVAADQISMANCAALDAAISSTEDFAEVALVLGLIAATLVSHAGPPN